MKLNNIKNDQISLQDLTTKQASLSCVGWSLQTIWTIQMQEIDDLGTHFADNLIVLKQYSAFDKK